MLELTCGKVKIPLALCSGISWTRTSRTVTRTGGYIVPLGFESTEVSVRAIYSYGVVYGLGLDATSLYRSLSTLATECKDNPDRLVIGGFEPLPTMLFALTSCNRTQVYDTAFNPAMELDLVFSCVRCKKECVRSEGLSESVSGQIPEIIIKRGDKSLSIKDSYALTRCVQRENSISISFMVRDDLSVIDRDGFLSNLVDGKAKVNFNGVDYTIISSDIDSNEVSIEGSLWPTEAQKPFIKTYRDTTLKAILTDIADKAGVNVDCRIDGSVDYYLNLSSPMEAITGIVESAGALALWRGNTLLIVDVPSFIQSSDTLEATVEATNEEAEHITSCIWSDGIISDSAGDDSGVGFSIASIYRGQSKASECLARAKFQQNIINCNCPARADLMSGSAVGVWVEKTLVDCLIVSIECDWLTGEGSYTLNYLREGV